VADAVAGKSSGAERTSFSSRETRKPRRRSSTYQALVIILAAAIVLFGLILALLIANYVR
jgi:hypothetical protein